MTPAIRQTVGEAWPESVTVMPVAVPERERTAADVLRAAARYIEEHGWYQLGGATSSPRAHCVTNTIRAVTGDGPDRDDTAIGLSIAACDRLAVHLGSRHLGEVWDWNDTPGRTEAEVLAALRLAAAAADGSAS